MTNSITLRRPRPSDPEIVSVSVEKTVLADVMTWLKDASERDEVKADLVKAVDADGYEFAKNLERRSYWDPDAELVEILSNYSTYSAMESAERDWVAVNGITIPFAANAIVIWRGKRHRVASTKPEIAKLLLHPCDPAEKQFDRDDCGWLVSVEDVTLAATALEDVADNHQSIDF
jgi:hypothetical protein